MKSTNKEVTNKTVKTRYIKHVLMDKKCFAAQLADDKKFWKQFDTTTPEKK